MIMEHIADPEPCEIPVIVRLQPLTPSLMTQLVQLARVGFTRPGFAGLAGAYGWVEQDEQFATASGHRLVPAIPLGDDWEGRQPGFHLPFCYADPTEDAEDGPLGAEFEPDEGWDVLEAAGDPFLAAWQHGHEVVSAELGAPEAHVTLAAEEWHFAAWRVGAAVLVVAQGEEFSSCGELSMAAVWVVDHAPDAPIPADGAAFYSWLLGEG
jgi:hypothetical protein